MRGDVTGNVLSLRHEAPDGRTHADDDGAPPHDAAPPTHDDACAPRNDATRQIKFFIVNIFKCLFFLFFF